MWPCSRFEIEALKSNDALDACLAPLSDIE
jgi:hypothetical protein